MAGTDGRRYTLQDGGRETCSDTPYYLNWTRGKWEEYGKRVAAKAKEMHGESSKPALSELVRRAQNGEQESVECLVGLVADKLRTCLYRLTLDRDLTEDLLQETLLHMVGSLKELKRVDAFWPWLYRTAIGKAQHHFRDKDKRGKASDASIACMADASSSTASEAMDGLSAPIRKELVEVVFEAMQRLNLRQRGVVVLRCFEHKSYADIAAIMGCSEIAAEVLFFRAKCSLRRHLSSRGFKGALLGVGLGAFARQTTSATGAAAGAVSGASLEVGVLAKGIAAVSTPAGIGIGMAAVAFLLAITAWAVTGLGDPQASSQFVATRSGDPPLAVRFEYPSRLLRAYDPDGDGWRGIEADQVVSTAVDPNRWLIGPPRSAQSSVVLQVGHWVELEFDGRIVDGPGDDIEVVEWGANGEEAHVFVTDGRGNQRFLGTLKASSSGLQVSTVAGFDLAAVPASFVPRAVRVVGGAGGGGTPGIDLHAVRARTARRSSRN